MVAVCVSVIVDGLETYWIDRTAAANARTMTAIASAPMTRLIADLEANCLNLTACFRLGGVIDHGSYERRLCSLSSY